MRDAVLARAARLGAKARALLDAAAIVPHRAELWLLDALGALEGRALEDCLDSGMLRADDAGVAFRHELARLAIVESLPPDRAVALAARPAGAPDLARLAHHAEAADDTAACCGSRRPPRPTRRRSARIARPKRSTPGRSASPAISRRSPGPSSSSGSPASAS